MGDVQFEGTPEEWDALVERSRQNKLQTEDVYEKFDRMLILGNEIIEDIKTRIAVNPDIVEMQENSWLYSIMSNILDDNRINDLKDRLKLFDNEINTQWKNKQQLNGLINN
jgi:hypothetical protein